MPGSFEIPEVIVRPSRDSRLVEAGMVAVEESADVQIGPTVYTSYPRSEANILANSEHWRTLFGGVRRTNTNTPL
jgi:hypothetical protein